MGQLRNPRRARARRPTLAVGAAVLAVTLVAGVAQAGEGPVPATPPGPDPAGAAFGEARPDDRLCPRQFERVGLCEGEDGNDHEAQADYRPFDGARPHREKTHSHGDQHAHTHPHQHSGGGAEHATGRTLGKTTLEQTIEGTGDPDDAFQTLRLAGGERRIVREDLAAAKANREKRRRSLLYVAQTTDWQLVDEESPARVEFVDIAANPPFPSAVSAAWRPQEALGPQAVEQSIRQINEFVDSSPVRQRNGRRASMDMVIMTGDQADNQQLNETEWVQRLLEGGMLDPNSGVDPSACPPGQQPTGQTADPELYAGVQDYDDYVEGQQFYDPDQPIGPKYADWPVYPGLVDRAQLPFVAQGLDVPSYITFGNHDGLAQGNQKAILPFELVGVGCIKPLAPVGDLTEVADVLDPAYLQGLLTTNPGQVMLVPPDPDRQYVDKAQFKDVFLEGEQPDGHGFAFVDEEELAASNGAASYYQWRPRPGISMIGIDTLCEGGVTGDASSGNIDDPQFQWLEEELERASERDDLVIVFGHHPIRSLSCVGPDETPPPCTTEGQFGHDINAGCDVDPRTSMPLHDGEDLTALFHRFPHVISYVAGHTHENTLAEFDRPEGGPGDFWGIETASLVDWPPQNRLIELMDNCDGSLSIFGTIIDGGAPATAPGSGAPADVMTEADLGSISRTLAYNDPQAGAGTGEGEPDDRNVELLLDDPRDDPPPCTRRVEVPPDPPEPPDGPGPGPGDDGGPSADSGAGGSLPFTGLFLGGLLLAAAALLVSGRATGWLAKRRAGV